MELNYQVSEEQRKIWAVQLDLLQKFKEICDKYGLRYSATAGTLLGAVRHKGFIPWDDDIDVALMWPDYQKLLEVAPKECQYPYFFQSYLTEKDSETNACRLRRSDTTGFTRWEYENVGGDYNLGIFIDIFPLFYIPDDPAIRKAQKENVLHYWKCIRGYNAVRQQLLGKKVNETYQQYIPLYEKMAASMTIEQIKRAYLDACAVSDSPQRELGATASRIHLPTLMWDTAWYANYIDLPFEGTTISCPLCYEEVLRKQYGDWRTPVMNGAMHEMFFVDTETPYADYLRTNEQGRQAEG